VIGKKFAGSTDSVEHWYGTEYSCMKLSEDVLQVEFFEFETDVLPFIVNGAFAFTCFPFGI